MANCLFCASEVPPNYKIDGDGKVTSNISKSEGGNVVFEVCEDDHPIKVHLNSIFILRKVLNTPTELIAKFLSLCEGDSHPELWINVCFFCMDEVNKFYECLKQVAKLERRIEKIRKGLKRRIFNSKDDIVGGSFIWKGIRDEALKNTEPIPATESEPPPSSPPPNSEEVQSPLNLNGNENATTPPPPPENDEVALIEDDEEDDDANADEMEIPLNYLELNAEAGILVDGVNQVEDGELLLDQIASSPSTSQSDSLSVSDLVEHQLPSSPIYIDLADSSDDENDQEQGGPPNKKIAKRFMDISNPNYIAYSFGDKRFFECRHCAYHGQRSEWLKNHMKVHDVPNSGAVTCDICFWHVLPSRIPLHYRIHHKGIHPPDKQKKKSATAPVLNIFDLIANKMGTHKMSYQCSECEASFTSLEACKAHAKRHIKPTYDWCQEGKEWMRRPKVKK